MDRYGDHSLVDGARLCRSDRQAMSRADETAITVKPGQFVAMVAQTQAGTGSHWRPVEEVLLPRMGLSFHRRLACRTNRPTIRSNMEQRMNAAVVWIPKLRDAS